MEQNYALEQAKAQMESIKELVDALNKAQDADSYESSGLHDRALENIHNDPLSVQVRSGWHNVGEDSEPEKFSILLCTGGPAVRIIGDLDEYLQPRGATIQYQDWGTPWTPYYVDDPDYSVLLQYCQQFYFGE